eukprot:322237-Chlamydomonas_euryale.AAC.3
MPRLYRELRPGRASAPGLAARRRLPAGRGRGRDSGTCARDAGFGGGCGVGAGCGGSSACACAAGCGFGLDFGCVWPQRMATARHVARCSISGGDGSGGAAAAGAWALRVSSGGKRGSAAWHNGAPVD